MPVWNIPCFLAAFDYTKGTMPCCGRKGTFLALCLGLQKWKQTNKQTNHWTQSCSNSSVPFNTSLLFSSSTFGDLGVANTVSKPGKGLEEACVLTNVLSSRLQRNGMFFCKIWLLVCFLTSHPPLRWPSPPVNFLSQTLLLLPSSLFLSLLAALKCEVI